jgi:hypothetical protein
MQWHHEVPWARSKLARALRVSPNTLCGLSTCAMEEMSAADDGLPWCPGCRDVESGWSYLRWALVRLARPAATHRAQVAAWESEQVRAEYAELVAWARAAVVSPWLTRRGDAAARRILGAAAAVEEITRARAAAGRPVHLNEG